MYNRSFNNILILVSCIIVQLGYVGPVQAQGEDATEAPSSRVHDLGSDNSRPWAKGVSRAHQEQARVLFEEANKLILQQFFKQAADKYREALDYWDHPAIHFNLSLALMNLDQPLELHRALTKALEHGVPPLIDESNYKRAESYLNIVSKQVAHIVVSCDHEGARVTMDGKVLFTGPGKYEGITLAGDHTVHATKDGYLPTEKIVILSAGEHERIELNLFTEDDLTIEVRRMPQWVPWVTLGSGAALLAVGGVLHGISSQGFSGFDSEFDDLCVPLRGCRQEGLDPDLLAQLTHSRRQQQGARISYIVGGTALAAGLTLLIINRPKRVRKESPVGNTASVSLVSVAPVLSPTSASLSARFRF